MSLDLILSSKRKKEVYFSHYLVNDLLHNVHDSSCRKRNIKLMVIY